MAIKHIITEKWLWLFPWNLKLNNINRIHHEYYYYINNATFAIVCIIIVNSVRLAMAYLLWFNNTIDYEISC